MFFLYPVGKIQKNSPKESVFVNLSLKNAVPYCQEYTPTDFFFGAILPTGQRCPNNVVLTLRADW